MHRRDCGGWGCRLIGRGRQGLGHYYREGGAWKKEGERGWPYGEMRGREGSPWRGKGKSRWSEGGRIMGKGAEGWGEVCRMRGWAHGEGGGGRLVEGGMELSPPLPASFLISASMNEANVWHERLPHLSLLALCPLMDGWGGRRGGSFQAPLCRSPLLPPL